MTLMTILCPSVRNSRILVVFYVDFCKNLTNSFDYSDSLTIFAGETNKHTMLLRATFRNILSFKEETQISFVAGKSTLHPGHVFRAEKRDDISVLKSGIIYGANASGKSNVIKAISIIQEIALGRFPLYRIEPFKLSSGDDTVSKIEVEFKVDAKFYAYGLEFSLQGIKEEWLFEVNSRSEKAIFTRKADAETVYDFGTVSGGASVSQLLKFLAHGTPRDKSFLSEYVLRNGVGLDAIKNAYSWFAARLQIIFPDTRYQGLTYQVESDNVIQQSTKSLLEFFNTGIYDIRRFPVKLEEAEVPIEILKDMISKGRPGNTIVISTPQNTVLYYLEIGADGQYRLSKQKAVHLGEGNQEVVFEMNQESDGSLRLLDFIPMLLDLRSNPRVYLVDEIDRSMHPMLSKKLMECYYESLNADRDTQLICTTHESNLLDLNLLRADEVWFVEKDKGGASHLTSLAEYKPREDVQKGYLQGRYGAIPFFASIKSLQW